MPSPGTTQNMINASIAGLLAVVGAAGTVFYVNSSSSFDSNTTGAGRRPEAPLNSVAYAFSSGKHVTAAKGDVIVCLPGHTEAIGSAAAIACSVSGVTIISTGNGRNRAVFTWGTATTATITVTAANIKWVNCVFNMTGFDAVASGFVISAADCTFEDCEFINATASAQATLCILTTAAADRLTVRRCQFFGTTDAGTAAAIRIVGGDRHIIEDNFFSGAYTTSLGAIDNATTACTNARIFRNQINNLTASSTKAMVFVSTSTGQISQNYMQILSGTSPITGAAMSWVGANYYAATIATAGTLI